ncbi:PulJ/GspJ family protein [Desulfonatronum parangueonense]
MPSVKSKGFTLLELITAMTITGMIVMMLYWAFAMGSRVWDAQDLKTSSVQREEAFFRLLDQDFREISPYNTRWERGNTVFFAGGPSTLFYVTRGGFGAQAREGKALFFACLFVLPNPEEGWDVALYKANVPEPALLEEAHAFQTSGDVSRRDWRPSAAIIENAVVFLEKLSDVELLYVRELPLPFQGGGQEALVDNFSEQNEYLEEWLDRELPGLVLVRYELEGRKIERAFIPHQGAL